MNESIIKEVFPINDLNSSFFDSLRSDYNGFDDWFKRKAKEKEEAYIQRDENGEVQAFLYLKIENEELKDVEPHLEAMRRLKIGTFKIEAHCTKLGERFFKKIFDHAINEEVNRNPNSDIKKPTPKTTKKSTHTPVVVEDVDNDIDEEDTNPPFDVDDNLDTVDFDFAAVRTQIRNLNKTGTPEQKKAVKAILNATGKKLDELEDVEALTQMLEVFE